jgi:peroxiredoxin Q/BCP
MVRAKGERQLFDGPPPGPHPGEQGQGFGHDFRADAVAGDEGHAHRFVQLSSLTHTQPMVPHSSLSLEGGMNRNWRVGVGIMAMLGLVSAAEIKEGANAPAFEALDQHGALVRLADFQGKAAVVLYFYPKDDTPGCTAQACSLRDGFSELKAAGAVILGVSADDSQSHKAFAEKYHLPFSLLADPDKRIIGAYGVKWPLLGIAKRVTFLIDRQGIVRKVITDIRTKDHDQQVLTLLKGMS